MRTLLNIGIIVSIILLTTVGLAKVIDRGSNYFTVYTPNDILYVDIDQLTIEFEVLEDKLTFSSKEELNSELGDITARMVQNTGFIEDIEHIELSQEHENPSLESFYIWTSDGHYLWENNKLLLVQSW